MVDLSEGKPTTNPILGNIIRARAVNMAWGGSFVTPANITTDVPQIQIEAALMFMGKAQRYKQTRMEIEAIKQRIRQRNKN